MGLKWRNSLLLRLLRHRGQLVPVGQHLLGDSKRTDWQRIPLRYYKAQPLSLPRPLQACESLRPWWVNHTSWSSILWQQDWYRHEAPLYIDGRETKERRDGYGGVDE